MIELIHRNLNQIHQNLTEKANFELSNFSIVFNKGNLQALQHSKPVYFASGVYSELATRIQSVAYLLVTATAITLTIPLIIAAIVASPSLAMKDNKVNRFVIEVHQLVIHELKIVLETIACATITPLLLTENKPVIAEETQKEEPVMIETPLQECKRLAKEGNANAQFELYEMYLTGTDELPADETKAEKWLALALANNHPDAQYIVGMDNYIEGNFTEAVSLFEKSTQQKFGPANFQLALCYHEGKGTPVNPEKARNHFLFAASQAQIEDAKPYLGYYLLNGIGGPQIVDLGYQIIESAVSTNNPNTLFLVGSLLINSPKKEHKEEALEYLRKAATENHGGAKQLLERQKKWFGIF